MAKKLSKTTPLRVHTDMQACPHHSKGMMVFKGIIAIILGLLLWLQYLTLAQTVAIILLLVGLKKILYHDACHC